MRIMLVCNAGVSTSIVVKKMQDAIKEKGLVNIIVEAVPTADAINRTSEPDVILLGPQVKFYLQNYQDAVDNRIPVDVIDTMNYGRARGDLVLEQALRLIENFNKKINNN